MNSLMDLYDFGVRVLLSFRDLLLTIIDFMNYELIDDFSVFEIMFGSALLTYLLVKVVV